MLIIILGNKNINDDNDGADDDSLLTLYSEHFMVYNTNLPRYSSEHKKQSRVDPVASVFDLERSEPRKL